MACTTCTRCTMEARELASCNTLNTSTSLVKLPQAFKLLIKHHLLSDHIGRASSASSCATCQPGSCLPKHYTTMNASKDTGTSDKPNQTDCHKGSPPIRQHKQSTLATPAVTGYQCINDLLLPHLGRVALDLARLGQLP